MLQCPNYSCQAPNAETDRFCHQCQVPLPRRYLWAVGHRVEEFQTGDLIAERYLCKASRIFLDTQPGLPPGTLSELPKSILPYLRLSKHQLHLPQVYGWADASLGSTDSTRLMFLENSALMTLSQAPALPYPLASDSASAKKAVSKQAAMTLPCLLPSLRAAWPHASASQQLNWLWQLAQLWQPCVIEHVAATLLIDEWIRVEGPLVRLVQLQYAWPTNSGTHSTASAAAADCTLSQLGQFWSTFIPDAAPEIRPLLNTVCQHLVDHRIADSTLLFQVLDEALRHIGRSQTLQLGIATQTDKGPSRPNNQDACFPASGTQMTVTHAPGEPDTGTDGLVLVCDGIGGHQGGEVASNLAIGCIEAAIQHASHPALDASTVPEILNTAVLKANDAISQRNDDEKRRDRERMGTTIVMGLVHDHDYYVAHIGDSRVYWITQWGCHQLTLDDDVASRDARLGYGTYRSVLYHPSAGALVQALGMGASKNLYPSVERFIFADEGLLLFCSDGLSDQDLVETCWESVLLPVVSGQVTDLSAVCQQLVDIANTHNGHDNVTVGLTRWRVTQTSPIKLPRPESFFEQLDRGGDRSTSSTRPPGSVTQVVAPASFSGDDNHPVDPSPHEPDADPEPAIGLAQLNLDNATPDETEPTNHSKQTERLAPVSSSSSSRQSPLLAAITLTFGVIVLCSIGSALAYIFMPSVRNRINLALGIESPLPFFQDSESAPPLDPDLEQRDKITLPTNAPQIDHPAPPFETGLVLQLKASTLDSDDGAAQSEETAPPYRQIPPEQLVLFTFSSLSTPSSVDSTAPPSQEIQPLGTIPRGSILQVRGILQVSELTPDTPDGRWVQVQVCARPETTNPNNASGLSPGAVGWVQEHQLKALMEPYLDSPPLPDANLNDACSPGLESSSG